MPETLTLAVARHAASTSYAKLPPEVQERAKQVVLDEVACAYFGRGSLAGDLGARYAAQAGGPGEARIYATGQRVSAPNAALANGGAGHGERWMARTSLAGIPARPSCTPRWRWRNASVQPARNC